MNENKFAQRLRETMRLNDITQVELCEKTKIPKSAMSQYANGKIMPKTDRLYILAQALNVNPTWLMGLDVPNSSFKESGAYINTKNHVQTINKLIEYSTEEIDDPSSLSQETEKKLQQIKSFSKEVKNNTKTTIEQVEDLIRQLDYLDFDRLEKFIEYQKSIKQREFEIELDKDINEERFT